jgi:predicted anti-sigma-YlaC factor YlaD
MKNEHGFDALIARAADNSIAAADRVTLDAHLAVCEACRGELDAQREARALLVARPIVPVRDLSAAIRRQLEREASPAESWIDLFNWRAWSLRLAPVAAALVILAVFVAGNVTATESSEVTTAAADTDASASVASALYSTDVSEEALLNLLLRANADEALSTYLPARQDNK